MDPRTTLKPYLRFRPRNSDLNTWTPLDGSAADGGHHQPGLLGELADERERFRRDEQVGPGGRIELHLVTDDRFARAEADVDVAELGP
jgi:hypothetical protein